MISRHGGILAVALLLGGTALGHAQFVEVSPFYGYRFGGELENAAGDRTFGIKDAPAYGVYLDIAPDAGPAKLALMWSRQDTAVELEGYQGRSDPDLTVDVIQAGGHMEWGDRQFRPYLAGLLGATVFSADGFGDDTRFSFTLAGGIKYYPWEFVALRLDLRGFGSVVESGGAVVCSGGCVGYFSGSVLWQGQVSAGISIAF